MQQTPSLARYSSPSRTIPESDRRNSTRHDLPALLNRTLQVALDGLGADSGLQFDLGLPALLDGDARIQGLSGLCQGPLCEASKMRGFMSSRNYHTRELARGSIGRPRAMVHISAQAEGAVVRK